MDQCNYSQTDPYTQAQKLRLCDLCETDKVQVHCDTCEVRLCNTCIGDHMASNESKKIHEIIRYIFRKPTFSECSSHEKERCELYCQQCDKPVCNICMASDQHKGHHVFKIMEMLDERKKKIIKEKNELKDAILPTYQESASDVEDKIMQLEKKCRDLTKAITKHGEEWHKKIDKTVTKLRAAVDEMKTEQLKTLQKHLNGVKKKISEIRKEITVIDDLIDSQQISELLTITFNVDKYKNHQKRIVLSFPSFNPGEIQGEELCSLFGSLSQRFIHVGFFPPIKQLLDEPEVLTTINTVHKHWYMEYLNCVACLSNEEIWTSGNDKIMSLYSVSQGSLLKSIMTMSGNVPTNIAVTKQGHLVYIDPSHKTINIVKNIKTETLITLKKGRPCSICSTSTGDLLVVINIDDFWHQESKIVRYSGPIEKETLQPEEEGKPFYISSPYCISENRNLDICVADLAEVLVFNQAGKLRFRYNGQTPASNSRPFMPVGITTDSQSHILIADMPNHRVHILDQYGQFLCYINCGVSGPWGLCVDTSDNLFVAQGENKQVKKIKYMEVIKGN